MRRRLYIILSFLLLATSCREPQAAGTFIPAPGPYVFTLDMSDTTAVYDLDLFTRVDAVRSEIPRELGLHVLWTSPSGASLREKVWLPLAPEVYEPYRSGVSPVEPGEWTLTLSPMTVPEGFRGLGLVVRPARPGDNLTQR